VFQICDENNVDHILMLLVVARQSRTFQLLTLAWAARCMGNGEGTQLTQTGQSDIPYHLMSRSPYKLGELTGGQQSHLRDGLGIVCQVVSN